MPRDILIGKITAFERGYYKVECDVAQPSLQLHFLRPCDISGAPRIGAEVELNYVTTPSSGLWKGSVINSYQK